MFPSYTDLEVGLTFLNSYLHFLCLQVEDLKWVAVIFAEFLDG